MNTPLDTFLSDQALATGRDLAANGTPTVVVLPAEGSCSWCDCDVVAKEHDPRFCAGCPNDAAMAMHIYSAATGQRDWDILLCPGHKDDAMRFITAIVASGGLR
ncbi:hypothetical protein [Streptomyces phaeochromogenes]